MRRRCYGHRADYVYLDEVGRCPIYVGFSVKNTAPKTPLASACVLVRSSMNANAARQTYGSITARLTARLAALQIMKRPNSATTALNRISLHSGNKV